MEPLPVQAPAAPHAGRPVARCLNCGTELRGPFCHACGQEGVDRNVSVGHLLREALGDLFSFDGRFARTLWPLFTRPGALTVAFNAGKRAPYVPPVRLYVFSSFLLFFVSALTSADMTGFFARPPGAPADSAAADAEVAAEATALRDSFASRDGIASFGLSDEESQALDAELDSLGLSSPSSDSWFGTFYRRQKARIADDPEAYKRHLAGRVSLLFFLLLPLFAAELKLLYLRRRLLYVQHVVFTLHVHAFAFLFVAALYVLAKVWGSAFLLAWGLPLYLFLAMRRVYGQSRLKTLLKEGLLSLLHLWATTVAILLYLLVQTLLY